METYEGACFLPIFLTLVLKEIKKKEIKKGDLREGLLPFLQILVTTSHPLCPRSHHYQRCHQKFALFRSYCGKPSSCIGWRSQGDFGQGLLCVHDKKPEKSTQKCVNSWQKCAYLVFWLVYLTLLYTNSELTLIKQSTFATTVCDSPANTSYADYAPHISSSLLKCWVSLHYLNFEGVGFLEPKVQQPTAANAKCSRHSPAKVEYFAPLQISDIFQHCLYCIFCCPANVQYLATHRILDILHPYQFFLALLPR